MRLLASSMLFLFLLVGSLAAASDRPNIIFMLSDDQNWNGTSVAMHPEIPWSKSDVIQTPSLEKLAAQGMRFSAAYAPASVCSPTRCSLQLGMSSAQTGWTKAAPPVQGQKLIPPRITKRLDPSTTTIAELLREAGYATAHYGKWHLSGGGPGRHGYDDDDGDNGNEYAHRFADPNPADIFGMAKRTAAFMEKSQAAGKPFFIQMSWHALHAPQNALKATVAKYEKRGGFRNEKSLGTAAITEDLDTGVGMVIESIDRLGLADNTFVIYMSDNGGGGGGKRGHLNGGKGSVWEGGIRSPLVVRGPGVDANSWCHTRVVGFDFFPTFCEWAQIPPAKLPRNIEGGSIASLLANNGRDEVKRPREELVFHFPHYQSGDGPHTALMLGNLKLMKFYETDRLALFDLSKDIQEQSDLAGKRSDDVEKMHDLMQTYLVDIGAKLPVANPNYDPANPPPTPEKGKRGGDGKRGGGKGDKTGRGGGGKGGGKNRTPAE
jgi:arylsulfatase A